ncbi:sugar ABC transporter permease [Paenibacillus baekrokdamisoli]|uniref:Sugar ABC transporter permease n=1 Tax=Paenibacillus baekrokdamisoli TaxID=1712516 RepID=A0A3G9ILR5_9BACL|nr:sugar ABC transporter permease [Paenibacillus baekrokdamisoli]MBB3067662.1 ABC-type sugar transport system permease subunit [Paenibacillus baekrokdamisoli]BBH19152.1 sugar ABC transporter permease [Paenibacillus baekrokdamisoli]
MKPNRRLFWWGAGFLMPSMIIFALFVYYPFTSSLYYSLTDWNGITKPNFVGISNYKDFFEDGMVMHGLMNTFYITLFVMIISNPISLILALLLNRPLKSRGFLRSAFYLPSIISLVVISIVWGNILQYEGVMNTLLHRFGLDTWIQDWLGSSKSAMLSIVAISVWQFTGYGAVIYLAGLQSIPVDIYEASKIDGASGWSLFSRITFPLLMPSVTICTFLGLVGGLKFFDLPFILTNGGPGDSTTTLSMVIFKIAFSFSKYGYATAAGVLFMCLIIIVTTIQLRITRKREVEY